MGDGQGHTPAMELHHTARVLLLLLMLFYHVALGTNKYKKQRECTGMSTIVNV